jgi:uncharacterized Zn finger protein
MTRWDYYEPSHPIEVKGGITAKSRKGEIGDTWWSRKWIDALKSTGLGSRLDRGRNYARKGQVISIDIAAGVIKSKVQGSRITPYSVVIKLKPLTEAEWKKVIGELASRAIFTAKLLSGEMPRDVEEAFMETRVPLFPVIRDDLKTSCSCPDWENPCKHVAAVYFLLAERFDEDPFLIFELRGQTKEEIIQKLRQARSRIRKKTGRQESEPVLAASVKLSDMIENFWNAPEGLEYFQFVLPETLNREEPPVLKRLGEAPFSSGVIDVRKILSDVYLEASRNAIRKFR